MNKHGRAHRNRPENNSWYKCLKPTCQAAFPRQGLLDIHMRIHNNEFDKCQYCQYRYVEAPLYRDHLNKHFRIKNHKCDVCGLTFTTKKSLVQHSTMHEGIIYSCLICKTYETGCKSTMKTHMRKHTDLLGENIQWDSAKEYVKLK